MTTPDDSPTAPVDLAPPAPPPPPGAPMPAAATPPPLATAPPAPEAASAPGPAAAPAPAAASAPAGVPPAQGPATQPANQLALVFGVLLLVIGGILLVTRITQISFGAGSWPVLIVVPGVALLIASFAVPPRGGLGLAIPGAIIATVGLILWFQAAYDAYATWVYAWALVAPTAPGLGTFLYGSVKGDGDLARGGLRMIGVGLALFAGFALFFEGVLGISGEPIANLDEVLPYAVIGLGVLLVALSFLGGGRRAERRRERGAR